MLTTILLSLGFGLLITLLILVFKLPTKIQYIEEIDVHAPIKSVYDAIRYQEQLMK